MSALVVAVCASVHHGIDKTRQTAIELLPGLGVSGDVHAGETVQHRSRVAKDPSQRNLRQVHLVHAELLDELLARGFQVAPGRMGENVTTRGVDLLGLATGTRLHLGAHAIVEVTGLRNPCGQLNGIQEGLLAATRFEGPDGRVVRKAGVMGVVRHGGSVQPGDGIRIEPPEGPPRPLEPV